ncbi:MAG: DNA polymerase III subunit beta, partial [Ardenticatenaceae bacterium]
MRVSCMQDKLHNGIKIVSRAVPRRSPYPVLSNIFFGTDNGSLRLSATDREIGITTWIEATTEESGETTLPAKLFSELVKQSPPERI